VVIPFEVRAVSLKGVFAPRYFERPSQKWNLLSRTSSLSWKNGYL